MVRLPVNIDRALQKFPGVAHGRQQRKPRQKFDGAPRESNRLNLSDSNRASHSIDPPWVSSRDAPLPRNFLDHSKRHQQRKKKRQSHGPAIKRETKPARFFVSCTTVQFLSHRQHLPVSRSVVIASTYASSSTAANRRASTCVGAS